MRSFIIAALSLLMASCAATPTTAPATQPQAGTTYYGTGGSAPASIVYVVDSRTDTVDPPHAVRDEIKRSLRRCLPATRFAIVRFSSTTTMFPDSGELAAASADTKRAVFDWLDRLSASTIPASAPAPAAPAPAAAIEKAIAAKPKIIYLIVADDVDPKLPEQIRLLNTDRRVKIFTIAFVRISREAEAILKTIAHENGGKYKFVGAKDLVPATILQPSPPI